MIRKNEKYSRPQTVLSLIILSILVIIGMGIVVSQNRFNPAILKKEDLLPAADADQQAPPASAIEAFAPLPPSLEPLSWYDARTGDMS